MMLPDSDDPLELWGGVECTVNRVGNTYRDQLALSGHDLRLDDLDRFARLGLRTLRFPVLWERVAPRGLGRADWSWTDARLARARALGIRPIVGLLHHGSGPADTSLLDPGFPERLAEFAGAVAARYPWVSAYTPVNEPLTTARFSALYGLWYPHARDDGSFVRAILGQCRATILAMRAIRSVTPGAALVQTEDLGRTDSTPVLGYQAAFDNERRWLSFDLISGRLNPRDRMWRYMRDQGVDDAVLHWFRDNTSPPDLLGINHYLTSNRYLDTDLDRYPLHTWGGNGRHRYADVEAVRVVEQPTGPATLLDEAWRRYRIPVAITEVHLGSTREEQLRWLRDVWDAANTARARGVDVRAVTAWSLLGSFDWNSLLTRATGHYEPGAFDVSGLEPRVTALGRIIGSIARGESNWPPVIAGPGWWKRRGRLAHGHVGATEPFAGSGPRAVSDSRPIVVTGASGTLGTAIGQISLGRGLEVRLLGRSQLDVADRHAVAAALEEHRPWAVINAAGYVRVDDAEMNAEACFRTNTAGAAVLASACARSGIELVTFSTDLVFAGDLQRPYVESDAVGPATVYGASKAEAERLVAEVMPGALIVRTSAFFGPWDRSNMLSRAIETIAAGREWEVPVGTVSPTYVPDLANGVLDLLIDGESGIWHLASAGARSWLDFIRRGVALAGLDPDLVRLAAHQTGGTPRPLYCALGTERGALLAPLDDALERYIAAHGAELVRSQSSDRLATNSAVGA